MAAEQVELHPEALAETEAALGWYLERSARAAEAFLAELAHGIAAVSAAPERWPLFLAGTRRYPYKTISLLDRLSQS
jgi:plasmid stabilization system protein ParE